MNQMAIGAQRVRLFVTPRTAARQAPTDKNKLQTRGVAGRQAYGARKALPEDLA